MPKKSTFNQEELRTIISNYNVGEIKLIEEFEKGEENINIFVETSTGKYVLRIYNQKRSYEQILFELSIMDYLFRNGFPTPKIILTKKNSNWFKYDDHFIVMFSYIEGNSVSFTELNKEQLGSVANNLSLMHKILLDFSPKGNKKREEMFWFEMEYDIQKNIFPKVINNSNFKEIKQIIEELVIELPKMMDLLSEFSKDIKVGIVHNDFQDGNMKFKGNIVSGIFDFDDSCPGAIISDLAIAINNFCFDNNKLNREKYDFFVRNYEKNIKLSEFEKMAIIPLMIHTNSFSIHNAIRLWSTDLINGQYYLSVIKWSYKKLKILSGENDF